MIKQVVCANNFRAVNDKCSYSEYENEGMYSYTLFKHIKSVEQIVRGVVFYKINRFQLYLFWYLRNIRGR